MKGLASFLLLLTSVLNLQCQTRSSRTEDQARVQKQQRQETAAPPVERSPEEQAQEILAASKEFAESYQCAYQDEHEEVDKTVQDVCYIARTIVKDPQLAYQMLAEVKGSSPDGTQNSQALQNSINSAASAKGVDASAWTAQQKEGMILIGLGAVFIIGGGAAAWASASKKGKVSRERKMVVEPEIPAWLDDLSAAKTNGPKTTKAQKGARVAAVLMGLLGTALAGVGISKVVGGAPSSGSEGVNLADTHPTPLTRYVLRLGQVRNPASP